MSYAPGEIILQMGALDVSFSKDLTFIAFDTETTGRYPIESEICEIAAVKFVHGEVVETFSTLIKPQRKMSEEVIKIHGITNEMVSHAPTIEQQIKGFHSFIGETTLVGHHSPFDLGFIAIEFEKAGLRFPQTPVVCSSRLARAVIKDSVNHKLQTLIPHLGLTQGSAHRATDDAQACGELLLKCIEIGKLQSMEDIWRQQNGKLFWKDYSINDLRNQSQSMNVLVACIEARAQAVLKYGGPSSSERIIEPIGLVRNPDGDFLMATDGTGIAKRFYLSKIVEVKRA